MRALKGLVGLLVCGFLVACGGEASTTGGSASSSGSSAKKDPPPSAKPSGTASAPAKPVEAADPPGFAEALSRAKACSDARPEECEAIFSEIAKMGPAAVPALLKDIKAHADDMNTVRSVQALARMGEPAIDAMGEVGLDDKYGMGLGIVDVCNALGKLGQKAHRVADKVKAAADRGPAGIANACGAAYQTVK